MRAKQGSLVKVGDLVSLKSYCLDRGRLAMIVEMAHETAVKIMFTDTGEIVAALTTNLEIINEC